MVRETDQKRKRLSANNTESSNDEQYKRIKPGSDSGAPQHGGKAVRDEDKSVSFSSSDDIMSVLKTPNTDLLVQGFTHLREHLKICTRISESREDVHYRALRESNQRVVYEWAEISGDFSEIRDAWNLASMSSIPRLDGLIPSTLALVLKVLDTPEHAKYGNKLIRMILDDFSKLIYRAFNTPRSFMCAAVLQLLYQMVIFSKGIFAAEIRQGFDWSAKSLGVLPFARTSGSGPNVRQQWIRFVFAFFSVDQNQAKSELLKSGRIVANLFSGVDKDTYSELHELLELAYTNIVIDGRIRRSDKTSLFTTHVIDHLMKLVRKRDQICPQEVGVQIPSIFNPDAKHIDALGTDSISALTIRFMKGLMCYPNVGICFKEYGLYQAPRKWASSNTEMENDNQGEDDGKDVTALSKGLIKKHTQFLCNSSILRILVRCIDPTGSKQMADLAVDILRASPELVAPFWRSVSYSFEPSLTLRYLSNTTLALKIMSLPLPLPKSEDSSHSGPPRLNTLLEHIVPFPLSRLLLGRGLQYRNSELVRYRVLLVIDRTLRKLDDARAWIRSEIQNNSVGSSISSKWSQFERQLLSAVKQRIPEWQLIVLVHQDLLALLNEKKDSFKSPSNNGNAVDDENGHREAECRYSIMSSVLMRVMNGYQKNFSELILESRFDSGRLIGDINLGDIVSLQGDHQSKESSVEDKNIMTPHTMLYLLQVLATTPNTHIKWMARVSSGQQDSSRTNFGVLLMTYLFATQPELRFTARTICAKALLSTGLFHHDSAAHVGSASQISEVDAWLNSIVAVVIPRSARAVRLDNITLREYARGEELVSFVEVAVSNCARLPYKHVDRIQPLMKDDDTDVETNGLPFSPLLSAVIESAILKASTGKGAMATSLEGASVERVVIEMLTSTVFVYIREVIASVAALRCSANWHLTRHLQVFLTSVVDEIISERVKKIRSKAKSGSDHSSAEEKRLKTAASAFSISLQGVTDYLLVIGGIFDSNSSRPSLNGSNEDREMAAALTPKEINMISQECLSIYKQAEFDAELVVSFLIGTLHKTPTIRPSTLTEALLKQAADLDGIVYINALKGIALWVSLVDRIGGAHSADVWDMPSSDKLISKLLEYDDSLVLLPLFRNLFTSPRLAEHVCGLPAQHLLVRMQLVSQNHLGFGAYALLLIKNIMDASSNGQTTEQKNDSAQDAIFFLFALVSSHLRQFAVYHTNTSAGSMDSSAPEVARMYSDMLFPLVTESPTPLHMSVNTCIGQIARMSLKYIPKKAAVVAWSPLGTRARNLLIGALADDRLYSSCSHIISIICLLSPVLDTSARTSIISSLEGAMDAQQKSQSRLLLLLMFTTFKLIDDAPNDFGRATQAQTKLLNIASIEKDLSARAVAIWLETFGLEEESENKGVLDDVVMAMTAPLMHGTKSIGFEIPDKIVHRIAFVKANMRQFDQIYNADGSMNIIPAIEYMWGQSAENMTLKMNQKKRTIVSRLLGSDWRFRRSAYTWLHDHLSETNSVTKMAFLCWLLHSIAVSSAHTTPLGEIIWDKSQMADNLQKCALELGHISLDYMCRDHASTLSVISEPGIRFTINACIQTNPDLAKTNIASSYFENINGQQVNVLDSEVLRSIALSSGDAPSCTQAYTDALVQGVEIGASLIQSVFGGSDHTDKVEEILCVLCSMLERSAHSSRNLSTNKKHKEHYETSIRMLFSSIDRTIRSICMPFNDTYETSENEIISCANHFTYTMARFVALAVYTSNSFAIAAGTQTTEVAWFDTLKCLLNCRTFNVRAQSPQVNVPFCYMVSGIWDLSCSYLSRWSDRLDDYLTLDELESLVGAYGGTRSISDRLLLRVISGYESITRQSILRVALLFGANASVQYSKDRLGRINYNFERNENDIGLLDEEIVTRAIHTIDNDKLFFTVLNFPVNSQSSQEPDPMDPQLLSMYVGMDIGRNAAASTHEYAHYEDSNIYDVRFILPWVWSIVSSGLSFDIRKLFESNAIGLACVALSAADGKLRMLAYYIFDVLYSQVADAYKLGGQRQYLHLLDTLRNSITTRNDNEFPRIPLTATLFVATSLNVMMHPDHLMFTKVNKMLLSRPFLDFGEIPLLNAVIKSTDNNPRRERTHVLRLAAQGARTLGLSKSAFKRHSFVNVLLTLASNPLGDTLTSKAALTFIFNLSAPENAEYLHQYITKGHGPVLAWLKQQLMIQGNALLEAVSHSNASWPQDMDAEASSLPILKHISSALVSLLALSRLVLRVTANYPLRSNSNTNRSSDYSRLWIVQSPEQPNAILQSSVTTIIKHTLDAVKRSLVILDNRSIADRPDIPELYTALLRTLLETLLIVKNMQMGANTLHPVALQDPEFVSSSLVCLEYLETAIDLCKYKKKSYIANKTRMILRNDTDSSISVATLQHPDSLFRASLDITTDLNEGQTITKNDKALGSVYANYMAVVDALFAWCFECPWKSCLASDSIEVSIRALVAGTPNATRITSWIQELHE